MHFQICRRIAGGGVLVVAQVGAVGGTHVDQGGAALAQHIRHAKAAADLHRLGAGHDDLATRRQCQQSQQHRRRVVVHGKGSLGPGDLPQERLQLRLAGASPPRLEIELQVGVPECSLIGSLHCGLAEGCPSQVGVNHHPGRVDHSTRLGAHHVVRSLAHQGCHFIQTRSLLSLSYALPSVVELTAHQLHHPLAAERGNHRSHLRSGQNIVDAGEISVLHECPWTQACRRIF